MQLTYPLHDPVSISPADAERLHQFRPATNADRRTRTEVRPPTDQVVAYLAPFLVLTAITQTTGLFAGAIDWLYPLRVAGVAVTLWICRSAYRSPSKSLDAPQTRALRTNRSVAWEPLVLGLAVFATWAWVTRNLPNPVWVAALQETPRYSDAWLIVRLAGFALAVPIAEELAFRGYLPRRSMAGDIETVAPGTFGWVAFIASSLWFGALHGHFWVIGTLQGMAYALALYRRGRVTDAIFAHIVTNVALISYALSTGHWAAVL